MALQGIHQHEGRPEGFPRRRRGAAVLAAVVLAGGLAPLPGLELATLAEATHLEGPVAPRLPNWRMHATSVWDGTHAYIIGGLTGWGSFTNEILRYNPATGSLAPMGARLPQAAGFHGTVWTGSVAFVFLQSGLIARFDPAADRVDVMGATFPGRDTSTAAWDGRFAYIFGGSLCFNGNHDILRYDPQRDVVEVMGATIPERPAFDPAAWGDPTYYNALAGWGYARGAAVSDGRYVYVLGGEIGQTTRNACGVSATNTILRYDPQADTLVAWNNFENLRDLHPYLLRAPIPSQSGRIPVAWDGQRAWIFHGDQVMTTNPSLCDRPFQFWSGLWQCPAPPIVYDTATNRLWMHCHSMPRVDAPAVWAGDQALVFSGGQGTNTFSRSGGWMMPQAYDARDLIFHHDDKCAPVPLISPAAPVECEDRHGTIAVDASRSYDPDGDPLTIRWDAPGTTFDDPGSLTPTARLPYGTTQAKLTLRDSRGAEASTTRAFSVVDTLPPTARVVRPQPGYAYVYDVVEAMHGGHAGDRDILAVGPLTVVADGEDRCGIGEVRFHGSDGSALADPQEPFTFRLDPSLHHTLKMKGEVRVRATAVDLGGNSDAAVVDLLHLGASPPCLRLVPSAVCEGPQGLLEG